MEKTETAEETDLHEPWVLPPHPCPRWTRSMIWCLDNHGPLEPFVRSCNTGLCTVSDPDLFT